MVYERFLLVCAIVACAAAQTQAQERRSKIPATRFTCSGRASGYYADVDTGCQVYHMCDGLGRQFSYSCPNTTLFQQRMLICDHWYMVNCSMSERDYDANLLIGQRDKPFVSDEEMRLRTPRPDILSVPPNNNYYDGLREAESKYTDHPGNSIVGIADTISSDDNDLDRDKPNYRPPTSWSAGIGYRPKPTEAIFVPTANDFTNTDNLAGAASYKPSPTFRPVLEQTNTAPTRKPSTYRPAPEQTINVTPDEIRPTYRPLPEQTINITPPPRERPTYRPIPDQTNVSPPPRELRPPFEPSTTTDASDEYELDIRVRDRDPVYHFSNRFDPNVPDSHKTAMSRSEIIDINQHLPSGQVSSEEERTPKKNKNVGNFNTVQSDKKKGLTENSKVKPNEKFTPTEPTFVVNTYQIPEPARELQPPKEEYSLQPSTTMGPPIYYEWKWAIPAYELEPPKFSNNTNQTDVPKVKPGKRPFSVVTRSTPKDVDPSPKTTEYNISSYFVPDYVFPLDGPHPGYENDEAETSFQVKISRPGRASFGENSNCPHCHPAYLKPGTCEPCIVKR